MSGMTTTGSAVMSDYSDRAVLIEVTGLNRQDIMKTSNYQVKVPFSRMNEEMRNISRLGGKVAKVTVVGAGSSESASDNSNSDEWGE